MDNLVTTFNGKLAQHLKMGQYFEIDVKVISEPKSFFISLATEKLNENVNADIGLHLLVNFMENQISANSRVGGNWRKPKLAKFEPTNGDEDDDKCLKICIHLWKSSFHISFNGSAILEMFYILDNDVLDAIQIGGDVKQILRLNHRQIFPEILPMKYDVPEAGRLRYVQFSSDVPLKLIPGQLIVVTGSCFGEDFGVYFRCGSYSLVFEVDFFNKNIRVFIVNGIGSKRSLQTLPFDYSKRVFRFGVACTDKEFLIANNGEYLCSFSYEQETKLSNLIGLSLYGRKKTTVKLTEADFLMMDSPKCADFVKYTKID